MKTIRRYVPILLVVAMTMASPALGEDGSPLNAEEQALVEVEENVLSLQSQLAEARARNNDPEKIEKLQKDFDELQKRRVELLRKTWQM